MLPLFLLVACAPVNIQPSTEPCVDWAFGEDSEPVLESETQGDHLIVRRNGVTQDCDATFDPEIKPDGRVIRVFEAWTVDGDGSCDACYAPTISLGPDPRGTYTVQWFDDSSDVEPVETIEATLE